MPWGFAVGAGIGALGNIIGGGEQASGQEQAAQTQQNMFNTIVGQEQPFLNAGKNATTQLNSLLSPGGYLEQQFNPTQAQLDAYPGYQFQLQTGGQALENANTPGVGALSGAALKSLMSFNQGTAASNYSNYFNQFQTQQNNIFNRLSNIASLGQNAAGNLGSAGANLGTGIAQAQAGAAGSIAGGIVGASNSLSNGVGLNYLLSNSSTPSAAYADPQFQNASNNYAQSQGYYPSS